MVMKVASPTEASAASVLARATCRLPTCIQLQCRCASPTHTITTWLVGGHDREFAGFGGRFAVFSFPAILLSLPDYMVLNPSHTVHFLFSPGNKILAALLGRVRTRRDPQDRPNRWVRQGLPPNGFLFLLPDSRNVTRPERNV